MLLRVYWSVSLYCLRFYLSGSGDCCYLLWVTKITLLVLDLENVKDTFRAAKILIIMPITSRTNQSLILVNISQSPEVFVKADQSWRAIWYLNFCRSIMNSLKFVVAVEHAWISIKFVSINVPSFAAEIFRF